MNLILVLVGAAALALIASYIWTVVLAFQRGAAWGFATLLVVGIPAFVIVAWEEARRPFSWFLVAILLVGAAWFSDPRNRLALNSSSGREMVHPRDMYYELTAEVKRKLANAPGDSTAGSAAEPTSPGGASSTAAVPSDFHSKLPPPSPSLAPGEPDRAKPGFFYLVERISVTTPNGVKAAHPGEEVRLLERLPGNKMRVTIANADFVVRNDQVTDDLNIAREMERLSYKTQSGRP